MITVAMVDAVIRGIGKHSIRVKVRYGSNDKDGIGREDGCTDDGADENDSEGIADTPIDDCADENDSEGTADTPLENVSEAAPCVITVPLVKEGWADATVSKD